MLILKIYIIEITFFKLINKVKNHNSKKEAFNVLKWLLK